MDFQQLSAEVEAHIFDILGYQIEIAYLTGGDFNHATQQFEQTMQRQTVRAVVLPVPISAIDGHHIMHGDSKIYLNANARLPEIGSLVYLGDVAQRVKSAATTRHNGVVIYHELIAGAV